MLGVSTIHTGFFMSKFSKSLAFGVSSSFNFKAARLEFLAQLLRWILRSLLFSNFLSHRWQITASVVWICLWCCSRTYIVRFLSPHIPQTIAFFSWTSLCCISFLFLWNLLGQISQPYFLSLWCILRICFCRPDSVMKALLHLAVSLQENLPSCPSELPSSLLSFLWPHLWYLILAVLSEGKTFPHWLQEKSGPLLL